MNKITTFSFQIKYNLPGLSISSILSQGHPNLSAVEKKIKRSSQVRLC